MVARPGLSPLLGCKAAGWPQMPGSGCTALATHPASDKYRCATGGWRPLGGVRYNQSMPLGERGLLELSELRPQELQLCAKAADGRLLDLRCGRPGEDDPVRG